MRNKLHDFQDILKGETVNRFSYIWNPPDIPACIYIQHTLVDTRWILHHFQDISKGDLTTCKPIQFYVVSETVVTYFTYNVLLLTAI